MEGGNVASEASAVTLRQRTANAVRRLDCREPAPLCAIVGKNNFFPFDTSLDINSIN